MKDQEEEVGRAVGRCPQNDLITVCKDDVIRHGDIQCDNIVIIMNIIL